MALIFERGSHEERCTWEAQLASSGSFAPGGSKVIVGKVLGLCPPNEACTKNNAARATNIERKIAAAANKKATRYASFVRGGNAKKLGSLPKTFS